MRYKQRSRPHSRSGASSDGAPDPESGREPWRAPVITRLTLDRTLFSGGSGGDGETQATPV